MAIGLEHPGIPFTAEGILQAPNASGVYALYNAERWVYVGETSDIQQSLGEHLAAEGSCIKKHGAVAYQFDFWPQPRRAALRDHWISTLHPVCREA
jgi:GIY-YIG catalytic domain